MNSTRIYTLARDLYHVFAILPRRLKLLASYLSLVFLFSASLEFLSLLFVGLFVKILASTDGNFTGDSEGSFAFQIAYTVLNFFPSNFHYLIIYIVILGSILLRMYCLVLNPIVVKNLSLLYSFRLVQNFTSMPILSFNQVSLSEFRTVLTEDLSSLINNAVRPTLAFSSSLFALIAACGAAYFSSSFLFFLLTITSGLCYLLYSKLYFSKMSLYLSNVIPSLDRSRSSILEYIYHNFSLIKLFDKSSIVNESFSQISSKCDAMTGVQNISIALPRLLIEFLIVFIALLLGTFSLSLSDSMYSYESSDLVVLFLSLTRAAAAFQVLFHNFGTLSTNSRRLHTVSSKLR
tara:strand:+ start:893 stop:1936 length:1044 start_codon:yes stop_codon:yes gene_type:complete